MSCSLDHGLGTAIVGAPIVLNGSARSSGTGLAMAGLPDGWRCLMRAGVLLSSCSRSAAAHQRKPEVGVGMSELPRLDARGDTVVRCQWASAGIHDCGAHEIDLDDAASVLAVRGVRALHGYSEHGRSGERASDR